MTDVTSQAAAAHAVHAAHIHVVNVIGGTVFFGALLAHMPTLALYTAGVGAVWYTLLAVREIIRDYHDLRSWFRERRNSRPHK